MTVNSKLKPLVAKLPVIPRGLAKDPRWLMRVALGVLLLANVAAALVLFKPWGASPEELEQELGQLRRQIQQKHASVERLRSLVEKSKLAREEGDTFMGTYFMDRRTASSSIVTELKVAAAEAGIEQKEHTFSYEPVEGSENLQMMTISGNYEGQYGDLVSFINLLDRSPRFLILDTLTASPERGAGGLNVNFKMNAFVIDRPREATPEAERAPETEGDSQAGEPAEEAIAE